MARGEAISALKDGTAQKVSNALLSGAAGLASFLFSLVHYIGPYADNLQLTSFTFRFVAGVILAGLFAVRGFAVAAWTHALYDVFLLLGGKG